MRQNLLALIKSIRMRLSNDRQVSFSIKRPLVAAGLLFALSALSSHALAQNVQYSANTPDQAFRSELRVDPSTLNMSLQIPLRVYAGRAGVNVPVYFFYSSKLWLMNYGGYYQDGPCCEPSFEANPQGLPTDDRYTWTNLTYADGYGSGWTNTLELPTVVSTVGGEYYDYNGDPCQECQLNQRYWVKRFRIKLSDGSMHELRRSDTVYDVYSNTNDLGTYYSVDGSQLKYVEETATSATLYLPDGSRFLLGTNSSNRPQQYIDRNGNTLVYNTNGTVTDTLGRQIGLVPSGNNPSTPDGDFNYTMTGVNGQTYAYTFRQRRLKNQQTGESVLTDPAQPLHYLGDMNSLGHSSIYSPSLFHSAGGSRVTNPEVFNPVVLSEIQLPNGSTYKFTYNVYGEIDKVVYPTGGYERFRYDVIPGLDPLNEPYAQTNRGVVERWVSADGTDTNLQHWQYSVNSTTNYTVRTTAPDGTYTELVLKRGRGPGEIKYGFDDTRAGIPTEERFYSANGTLLRRTLMGYAVSGSQVIGSRSQTATRNPRLTKQVDLLLDTGGDAIACMTTYEYDPDLNVVAVHKFDYVVLSPSAAQTNTIAAIPQGAPLRTDETTFLVNDAAINSSTRDAYRARNLLSLPTSARTKNGSGSIVSQQTMQYDEPSYPLLAYNSVATGWADPQINTRGNITSTGKWLDTIGAYLETHAQYDQCGNIRYLWDAKGNQSQFEYADSFNDGINRNTFAFPTNAITAIPDTSGVNGSGAALLTNNKYDFSTGLVISTTDPNGQTTLLSYDDPLNRLKTVTRPAGGGATSYEYGDSPNNLFIRSLTAMDAARLLDAYQYFDGLGRPVRSLSFDGSTSSPWIATDIEYDLMSRTKKVSNPYRVAAPGGAVSACTSCTTTEYDDLSRVIKVTTPDGAQVITAYGASTTGLLGLTMTVTDQSGKKRKSLTDALSRMVQVNEDPDGLNYESSYQFDTLGNLRTITQGAQVRTFVYDSLSRLTSATNPESGTVTYQYDSNANLALRVDARGVKTSYSYDSLNRVKSRSYSLTGQTPPNYVDTPTVNYFYDGTGMPAGIAAPLYSKGRPTAVKSLISETIYTNFDAAGRVTKHRQISEPGTANEQVFLMEYTYNLLGAMTSQKYPSGKLINIEYDASARVAGLKNQAGSYYAGAAPTDEANRIQYAAHGAVTDMRLGNGLWEHRFYNGRLQPTEIGLGTQKGGSDRLKLNYSYGTTLNNSNLLSQTITVPSINGVPGATFNQAFSYDPLNRLQSASESGGTNPWTQTYTYASPDGTGARFGNRRVDAAMTTPNVRPASIPTFDLNTNHFAVNQGYAHDQTGNLITAPGFIYAYDAENHMVSADNGQTWGLSVYYYDGDGRRIRKVTGANATTVFVYNISGQMVAEYANAMPPGQGGTSYLTADNLGTPRVITGTNVNDATGGIRERHDYLPFGEELTSGTGGRTTQQGYSNADSLRQKWTGKERDAETGLDYFGARYYGATLGRFTSVDPIKLTVARLYDPQRINLYGYCRNNPLTYLDPDGQDLILANATAHAQIRSNIDANLRASERANVRINGNRVELVNAGEINIATASPGYRHLAAVIESRRVIKYFGLKEGESATATNGDTVTYEQARNGRTQYNANGADVFVGVGGAADVYVNDGATFDSFPEDLVFGHEVYGHGQCGRGQCAVDIENELRRERNLPLRTGQDHQSLRGQRRGNMGSTNQKVEVMIAPELIETTLSTPQPVTITPRPLIPLIPVPPPPRQPQQR